MRKLLVLVMACSISTSTLLATEVPRDDLNAVHGRAATKGAGWLAEAVARETRRAGYPERSMMVVSRPRQPAYRKRSWLGRHPVLAGTLIGFGTGFLIGYLPGDDAVFDDFTAGFNGWVMGGVGAATGAAVGAVIGAATK